MGVDLVDNQLKSLQVLLGLGNDEVIAFLGFSDFQLILVLLLRDLLQSVESLHLLAHADVTRIL